MTQAQSPVNAAISAFLSTYTDVGAADVSAIVAAAKQAAADKRGMQASLFVGFLALAATGADPAAIRATGATIRKAVTRVMRTQAGFPADKVKGAKESGAPDFSTASVYAGIVADCLGAQRDNLSAWEAAFSDIGNATETPPAVHACGLYDAVNANKRTLAKYAELCEAEMRQRYPALATDTADGGTQSVAHQIAELTRENAALRAYREAHLQPGDAAEMVSVARAERDAATEALMTASDVARRQAAELEELRAIAAESARIMGKGEATLPELLAELQATDAA